MGQYLWMKAVQWASPTAATVGLSLTIPMSVVTDILRRKSLTVWSYAAAGFVISGFVAVSHAAKPQETSCATAGETCLLGHATAELFESELASGVRTQADVRTTNA